MARKKLSVKEYRKSLEERYGEDLVEDFDAIFSGDITLTKISKKHKISKMRASQIFSLLYGKTFSKVKRKGAVTDAAGTTFPYEPGKTKQFMVILSVELDAELTRQAKEDGKSKAAFVRDSVINYISKDDPLSTLARKFK